jgi:glycosyltransferase involved in cell wall biosynthesis
LKIYIVTVCLNANEALRATIDSISALRTGDVYYLVVDGNSSDGTKETLIGAGRRLDRWVSEPDHGIYDAMNKAISLLPSEEGHVLFLGAGDRLLALPASQQRQGRAVLFGNVQIGDTTFNSSVGWKLKLGNTLHHQGLFVPKALLANTRFDVRFKTFADFDLNQRLFKAKIPFRALNTTIAFAHPGGLTSGGVIWSGPIVEMLDITRKNYGIFWQFAARIWRVLWELRQHLPGRNRKSRNV